MAARGRHFGIKLQMKQNGALLYRANVENIEAELSVSQARYRVPRAR